jgi:hypothetical protein
LGDRKLDDNGFPTSSWASNPDLIWWDKTTEQFLANVPGKRERVPEAFEVDELVNGVKLRQLLVLVCIKHNSKMMGDKTKRRGRRVTRIAGFLRDGEAGKLVALDPPCSRCTDLGLECVGRGGRKTRGRAACLGCSALWVENELCSAGTAATAAARDKDEEFTNHLQMGQSIYHEQADHVPGIDRARAAWERQSTLKGYTIALARSPRKKVEELAALLTSVPDLPAALAARKRRQSPDETDDDTGSDKDGDKGGDKSAENAQKEKNKRQRH